jgi:hypothetical protein
VLLVAAGTGSLTSGATNRRDRPVFVNAAVSISRVAARAWQGAFS